MKITARVNTPHDVDITITATMRLSEWRLVLRTLREGNWSQPTENMIKAIEVTTAKISTTVESDDISTPAV